MGSYSRKQTLNLLDRIIEVSTNEKITHQATKMRAKLMLLPMSDVLKKVPGKTLASKARYIGVAKETCHGWYKGAWRPSKETAQKLSKITGYPIEEIYGGAQPLAGDTLDEETGSER